ncbi:MAG TPA: cytochrome c biogenesis protein CcdA [Candidatus Egerieousia sp.]|nr:cytochrome c biogenesis protein CcdA [Candidatus Egerieousia sp.]HPT05783.1 cytochrome c biogenesis protein CcdA [Candidatus Egerieousia sp.]
MKKIYRIFAALIIVCGLQSAVFAGVPQFGNVGDPVTWTQKIASDGNDIYEVQLVASIEPEWHVYDFGPYTDGPNATTYKVVPASGFLLNKDFRLIGKPFIKGKVTKSYDDIFQMNIGTFGSGTVLVQKVQVLSNKTVQVVVHVEWQACKSGNCVNGEKDLNVTLAAATNSAAAKSGANGSGAVSGTEGNTINAGNAAVAGSKTMADSVSDIGDGSITNACSTNSGNKVDNSGVGHRSLWSLVLEAILWGFAMLITPCVFPMVPMTVSFFMHNSEEEDKKKYDGDNKKKTSSRGKFMASMYGLSIVALYTLPIAIIILITYLIGGGSVTANIFNWLATNWIPNLIFFIVFFVFALSFFGAFEIVLPSWMVNKADSKSDKGGLLGVFFMALTLVLVSFSCTGPIVGSILIRSTQGEIWAPVVAMLAFSIAFAIPFTIFAFIPSLLDKLPKSGGWLNSVKVVLGFIELALGMKFLSIADQTYHWGILDREVYLAFWIVIFTLLGIYLLGKIRFQYDSKEDHVSIPRLLLAIIDFAFVVYMIPGMWGAPLKALSGYLPPIETQDFRVAYIGAGSADGGGKTAVVDTLNAKYSDMLHLPQGLQGFFNYDEALAYAQKVHKPVFLDFTGHGCVNCREMEARVWSNPIVLQMLKQEYIVCALYADDKITVPAEDQVTLPNGKVLSELGDINSNLMLTKFKANAQPYYIILNETGKPIVSPMGYNLDVKVFTKFLQDGIKAYGK